MEIYVKMHFFVWLLILLLIVLTVGMAMGAFYLASSKSNQDILNEITFTKIETSLGNSSGDPAGTLWKTSPSNEAVLAKLQDIRTFLALADWFGNPPIPEPDLPLYFTLPEPAVSVKTFIAGQAGIPYTGDNNNLVGFLLSPTRVGFHFAHDEVVTNTVFTGNDVRSGLQELGVVIIYTLS